MADTNTGASASTVTAAGGDPMLVSITEAMFAAQIFTIIHVQQSSQMRRQR